MHLPGMKWPWWYRLIEDIKDFAASEIDWQLDEKLQSFAAASARMYLESWRM